MIQKVLVVVGLAFGIFCLAHGLFFGVPVDAGLGIIALAVAMLL
jgi:hypothetical protein